jgi:hypothetical protein
MDLFGDLYNRLDFYLEGKPQPFEIPLSNHLLSRYHIRKLGLENKISYILNEHTDFNLKRQI